MSEVEIIKHEVAKAMTQHLYRHFDKDGVLLYVGVSLSALKRLAEHRSVSHWFNEIATVKIEHFNSRKEVLAAERDAITAENPKHNLLRPGQKVLRLVRAEESSNELLQRVSSVYFIYTPKSAADAFGIGLTAMKRIIDSGLIGTVTIGGKSRITGWQMIEYLEYLQTSQKVAA